MNVSERAITWLRAYGLKWALVATINLALLYTVIAMYFRGEVLFPLTLLLLGSVGNWIFISKRGYAYRYVYPCLVGIMLFVIFPLLYTFNISFTNYGSANILTLERVKEIHLDKMVKAGDEAYTLGLYQLDDEFQLTLTDKNDSSRSFITDTFTLSETPQTLDASAMLDGATPAGKKAPMRMVVKNRAALQALTVQLDADTNVVMTSLREFAAMAPQYREADDHALIELATGKMIRPDMDKGYYMDEAGELVSPGFTVYIGGENYDRLANDKGLREPFFKILIWNITFAFLSVLFCASIGLLLAILMQWEPLKERGVYRVLLILPYAVPAFISILIFKGLFNQNFGEINMLLEGLFGIKPEWGTDVSFARTMILIVNTWLGYPYMMIISMGLLKAISETLYEASAIDGCGPIQNLMYITLPSIAKPMAPILIASFAFNFNNFVLIDLLTGGGPMMPNVSTEAGFTDLLVSFTFRTAFVSGQDFGLASAIATGIFLIVGFMAWANLRAMRSSEAH